MKRGFVVSKNEQISQAISSLLFEEGFDEVLCASDSIGSKKILETNSFDLIIINTPIENENGLHLASFCAKTTQACVFVIVPDEKSDEIAAAVSADGVFVISRPIKKQQFHRYVVFSVSFRKRMLGLIEENSKLKNMVEEMKLVNRAKLLLMQCLNMSETQAHSYMEKQAMNMRMTKLDIAKQIIKTYEN